MKKASLIVAVALMLAFVLTACGGQGSSTIGFVPSSMGSIASSMPDTSTSASVSSDSSMETTDASDPAPIYGSQIADGVYAIEVTSSSSMFKIVDCQLTVAGEEMTAVLTLSGTGYEKLYMGTGKEAESATDDAYFYFVENAEGAYTYEVPVQALDMEIDCTAFSIRKQTWYDRVLVFQSDLIPADAINQ